MRLPCIPLSTECPRKPLRNIHNRESSMFVSIASHVHSFLHSFIHSSKIIIQYLFITDYLVIIENKNSTFDLIGEVRVYMEEEEEGVIKDVPPWINKSKFPFYFTEHISLGCGVKQRFSRGFFWATHWKLFRAAGKEGGLASKYTNSV